MKLARRPKPKELLLIVLGATLSCYLGWRIIREAMQNLEARRVYIFLFALSIPVIWSAAGRARRFFIARNKLVFILVGVGLVVLAVSGGVARGVLHGFVEDEANLAGAVFLIGASVAYLPFMCARMEREIAAFYARRKATDG